MRKIALFFCLLFAAMASHAQLSKCGTPDRIKLPIQGTAARVAGLFTLLARKLQYK